MKAVTYYLIFVLGFLSIFTIGYLITNKYISFGGANTRIANILRFTEPAEVKSLYDLLDKLPSEATGPAVLDRDGQSLLYYDASTGYLHQVTLGDSQSHDEKLQKLFPYLVNLRWSQSRDKLLASNGADTILYDLAAGESKLLPQNIQSPVFSSSGDKLAYIDHDAEQGNAWVAIADPNFESAKKLLSIASGNWLLNWIDQNNLSLLYNNLGEQGLMETNVGTSQLTRVIPNSHNLEINWSRDGQSLLYSYLDTDNKLTLAYKNIGSGNESKLPVETLASSCVWSIGASSIFCSVNKNGPQENEDDVFVMLKFGSNPQNLHVNNSSKIKTENLLLSADEKYLFFRNTYTGNFYRLRIVVDQ